VEYRAGPRGPSEARGDQLANPVAAVVQKHQPDGHRDHQQIELANPAQRGGFGAVFGHVHLADGEARPRAGMAFSAGARQVLGVDGGLGSDDGRMLCTPWQLAQLATVCDPSLAASPWYDASKLVSRSRVTRTCG